MIYIFIFFFLSFCIIFYMTKNKRYLKTSEMAIVMALGITMHGVLSYDIGTSFYQSVFAKFLLAVILAIWIAFTFSIILTIRHKKFNELHSHDPVNRFGIGTWIAATSICWVLIVNHLPLLGPLAKIIIFLNIGLWFYFISISMKAFLTIYRDQMHFLKKSNGIFLLTTVSTQSIVVFLHYVFEETPRMVFITFIGLGLLFYFIGAFLIIKRYSTTTWSFEKGWENTNCILHGALSITGLAAVLSDVVHQKLIMMIWILTLLIFVLIEAIEIYRGYKRINRYGFRKGIFVYDASQWSRVFTFGMFYTFTSYIRSSSEILTFIQSTILELGIWVVSFLILFGFVLTVKNERDMAIRSVSLNMKESKSS